MQAFIIGLIVKALENDKIREFLFQIVDRLADRLLPKLASVIPLSTAAGMELFGTLLQKATNIDLPGPLPSVAEMTEQIHNTVNNAIPDVDIPFVSDAFKNVTGFDLTDILRRR